ncbi:segregation/condensation protein A [Oceanobacillus kapialis]|uniref:Segregation and condensation protein A n=1 Tax=Oceanobacillus kapialis TaxID=481353 RepID=A0ABW5Q512_9BACI
MSEAYQVKLEAFEGPLDLLLHLINKYEIDINDIPVAQITEQYMQYIHTMQKLDLNIASEYLVMAATLVAIKSQMLLPKQEIDEELDDYVEDPREELMQRLIEYRKYKDAAEKLKEKEDDSSQLFTRSPIVFRELKQSPTKVVQGDLTIYDMLGALGKMMERKKWKEPLETKVQRAEIPIEQRMEEVIELVRKRQNGIYFDELFTYQSRTHIVVTFMAVLELMKSRKVFCEQERHFDALLVHYMEE